MTREQELHDWLLEHKPEGANHKADECKWCKESESREENVSDKIFTQEQLDQLVASAVDKAVSEARKTADGEILTLNARLEDAATALKESEVKVTELSTKISEREEADRLAAVAAERAKQVAAVANFSQEQIEARQDGWAKMDEAAFNAYLEDVQLVAKSSKEKKPATTKFDGTRETAGDETEKSVIDSFFNTSALSYADTV